MRAGRPGVDTPDVRPGPAPSVPHCLFCFFYLRRAVGRKTKCRFSPSRGPSRSTGRTSSPTLSPRGVTASLGSSSPSRPFRSPTIPSPASTTYGSSGPCVSLGTTATVTRGARTGLAPFAVTTSGISAFTSSGRGTVGVRSMAVVIAAKATTFPAP